MQCWYGREANVTTIKDHDIQAFLDNELSDDQARKVIVHLQENPRACKRYQTLLKQKAILQQWWINRAQS